MARIAYAARTLLEQVDGTVVGDPDGLGVYRNVAIPVGNLRRTFHLDDRIREVAHVEDVLIVTFVTGRKADLTHPFEI